MNPNRPTAASLQTRCAEYPATGNLTAFDQTSLALIKPVLLQCRVTPAAYPWPAGRLHCFRIVKERTATGTATGYCQDLKPEHSAPHRDSTDPQAPSFAVLWFAPSRPTSTTATSRVTRYALRLRGGADRDRTGDPLLAKQVLSQLSYSPELLVGLVGVEPTTPRLSSVCSNQLSYRPS